MKKQNQRNGFFYIIRILVLIFFFLSVLSGTGAEISPVVASIEKSQSIYPYIQVVATTGKDLTLEITPPAPEFVSRQIDNQFCAAVQIKGLNNRTTAGRNLPVMGTLIGIPQSGTPTLEVVEHETSIIDTDYPLCPTPQPVIERSIDGTMIVAGQEYTEVDDNPENNLLPDEYAQLTEEGYIRSQRFAKLQINPVQYNAQNMELHYITRLVITVHFNPVATVTSGSMVQEAYFEEHLSKILVNYQQSYPWRMKPNPVSDTQTDTNEPWSDGLLKLIVSETGMYQVSYTDLVNAGISPEVLDGINPTTIKLFNGPNEVAILVIGEEDNVFNEEDHIIFYGTATTTKYTSENVYWLDWGGLPGLRMIPVNGTPGGTAITPTEFLTVHRMEEDVDYYNNRSSGPESDHWYWSMVYAGSAPAYLDFKTTLQHISTGTQKIIIKGLLKSQTATPQHHTKIYLNGTDNLIDDAFFPKGSEHYFEVEVSQSLLVEGENTIRVECPRDAGITRDLVLVNWFEIEYFDTYFAEGDSLFFDGDESGEWNFQIDGFSNTDLEIFDVTDPYSPLQVTDFEVNPSPNGYLASFDALQTSEHHYLAQGTNQRLSVDDIQIDIPSNWHDTTHGADYIIISHQDFFPELQPLVDLRASQGKRVVTVDVQDLYDEFNGGVFSPEAIKDFLAFTYTNWVAPAPSFVLLVGDGHYDFKNIYELYGRFEVEYIPPYLDDVDPWIGETATDNRFVSINGDDILPDMYIGRFPVKTVDETRAMVEKVVTYETLPPIGDWNLNLTFIADDPDSAGDYEVESETLIDNYVPDYFNIEKIYYGSNYLVISETQAAIKASINDGALIVNYIGHGDLQNWAFEKLLNIKDIKSLTNADKLPLFLPMTCLEGYFIHPSSSSLNYSSLGESSVRYANGGAIASWSPTGYGLTDGHVILESNLFDNFFNNQVTQLGPLTNLAKYYLFASGTDNNDLIETYVLFGDPALRLHNNSDTLQAPSDLNAREYSCNQIELSWVDNSSDESGFSVERSLNGNDGWEIIALVNANITGYIDTGLSEGTEYYYRVQAYRQSDLAYSQYSNTMMGLTYPFCIMLPYISNDQN